MGNSKGKIKQKKEEIKIENVALNPDRKFNFQLQTNSIKNRTHGFIKTKNYDDLVRVFRIFDINTYEELSSIGHNWNSLHYAAHFDSTEILEFLIQITYRKNPDEFEQIMNFKNKTGMTPAMTAVVYNKVEPLKIFLKYGGVNANIKDNERLTIFDLAKSNNCKIILEKHQFKNGEIKPNYELLESSQTLDQLLQINIKKSKVRQDISDGKKIEFRHLLLEGELIPCGICIENCGYLQYSICCGQPIHQTCLTKEITRCPYCNAAPFSLIPEILFPERALSMPNDIDKLNQNY